MKQYGIIKILIMVYKLIKRLQHNYNTAIHNNQQSLSLDDQLNYTVCITDNLILILEHQLELRFHRVHKTEIIVGREP